MSAPEFSRPVNLGQCDGLSVELVATEEERAALAARFDLVRIDRLEAALLLARAGDAVSATGRLAASVVQTCAVSAEDLATSIEAPVVLRFIPARTEHVDDEDIEIDPDSEDEIEYAGTSFDLGEAVAQSLALAIDPFARGPGADSARTRLPAEGEHPFAALAALRGDKRK